MRSMVCLVAALLLFAAPATAVPPKRCASLTVSGTSYVVTAHGVTCGYARRWVGALPALEGAPQALEVHAAVRRDQRARQLPRRDEAEGGPGLPVLLRDQDVIATAAHAGHAPPTVSISVYAYAPASIGVVEGDIVQWNWDGPDTNHSVTSDARLGRGVRLRRQEQDGCELHLLLREGRHVQVRLHRPTRT